MNCSTVISFFLMLATVGGFLGLIFQSSRTKRIEEYKFLIEAEKFFSDNEKIQSIHKKVISIDKNTNQRTDIDDEDIECISAYATFFETFYPLVKRRLLKIREIDDQFGYRFFVLLHNKDAQDKEIFPDKDSYRNLARLYEKWYNHRKKAKKVIPSDENRLFINKNKNDGIKNTFAGRKHSIRQYAEKNSEAKIMAQDEKRLYVNKSNKDSIKDTFANRNNNVRKCDAKDSEAIIKAQREVFDWIRTEDSDIFIGTDDNVIDEYLTDPSSFITLGLFEKDVLCAYLFLILKPDHDESLNDYLADVVDSNKVATLDTIAVLPKYRGQGYQRLLMRESYKYAMEKGCDVIATGTSPYNFTSLSNIVKEKFITHKKVKLHGKDRVVLYKEL